ncbi:MAG: class II aldolase/adducin family protein [Myxococcota bacterium]
MIDPDLRRRIVEACVSGPSADEAGLRRLMVDVCRRMNGAGLNQGKSGNLSARLEGGRFLMTPSGVDYEEMRPEDVVRMSMNGSFEGPFAPSTEWRMHRDLLLARPETGSILHAHSPRSTALACHGRGIPPFHYMVAVAGGTDVRCAPYATFGSPELASAAVEALQGRKACLLAHHGILCLGEGPREALDLAVEVEALSGMYLDSLAIGEPPRLSDAEMSRVLAAFETYGRPRR